VRECSSEEGVDVMAARRIERDMGAGRRRIALEDREVLQSVDAVVDAVGLDANFFVAELCEGGRVELTARNEVADDEQDVVNDDPPRRHRALRPSGTCGS
jgi:hypothetical protein